MTAWEGGFEPAHPRVASLHLVAFSSPAHADQATASAAFTRAQELAKQGKWAEACRFPNFPGGSGVITQQPRSTIFKKVAKASGAISDFNRPAPNPDSFLWWETSQVTMVGNASSLIYLDHVGSNTVVRRVLKSDQTRSDIDVSIMSPSVPVGLAADDNRVAIAVSVDVRTGDASTKLCAIRFHDLVGGMKQTLLNTTQFSCIYAALDATHVYVAIVSVTDDRQTLRGIGIARVKIDDGSVESLALGIEGRGTGPRRIYLDGESMFVVDPYVIAKISKHALDGRHDFTLP
jgi:hypothetical protein